MPEISVCWQRLGTVFECQISLIGVAGEARQGQLQSCEHRRRQGLVQGGWRGSGCSPYWQRKVKHQWSHSGHCCRRIPRAEVGQTVTVLIVTVNLEVLFKSLISTLRLAIAFGVVTGGEV